MVFDTVSIIALRMYSIYCSNVSTSLYRTNVLKLLYYYNFQATMVIVTILQYM